MADTDVHAKNCPFCGQKPVAFYDGDVLMVGCSNQYCQLYNLDMSITAWNKRPIETQLMDILRAAKVGIALAMSDIVNSAGTNSVMARLNDVYSFVAIDIVEAEDI